ncbi:MAG: hypothetical protein ACK2UK_10385 [Candidatus Promineifilaceae bacterium]
MRKLVLGPLLLITLFLAACGGTAAPAPTREAGTTGAAPDSMPATAETAAKPVSADVATGSTPEEASIVRPQDHTQGASDAQVTIIEYGDFQ